MSSQQTPRYKYTLTLRGALCGMTWQLIQTGSNTPAKERTIAGVTANFPLYSESDYWRLLSWGGDFGGEVSAMEDIIRSIKPTDIVWDIGANKGNYTVFLSQVAECVHSFEPDEIVRDYLARIKTINGISNITIHDTALGSADGVGGFEDGNVAAEDNGGFEIRRGDTLVKNGVPMPDVIKADIEGGELDVLDGLGDVLKQVRLVYLEPHPSKGTPLDALQSRLYNEGFETDIISTDCMQPIIKGER